MYILLRNNMTSLSDLTFSSRAYKRLLWITTACIVSIIAIKGPLISDQMWSLIERGSDLLLNQVYLWPVLVYPFLGYSVRLLVSCCFRLKPSSTITPKYLSIRQVIAHSICILSFLRTIEKLLPWLTLIILILLQILRRLQLLLPRLVRRLLPSLLIDIPGYHATRYIFKFYLNLSNFVLIIIITCNL